nr:hypothetical protein [Desulfobulbaceae bacterium]
MDEILFYKAALKNLTDLIVITDDHGNILFLSTNASTILSYKPDTALPFTNISSFTGSLLIDSKKLDTQKEVANIEVTVTGKAKQKTMFLVNVKRINLPQKARLYSFRDITKHTIATDQLVAANKKLELLINKKSHTLHNKTIALSEVLNHLEIEKQNIYSRVDVNVHKLLLPIIDRLIEKASSLDSSYLKLVKQNLSKLTSSLGIKLTSLQYRLTPKEIELCNLIKGGFSIKEIAVMQNLSERTVETHRLNIRKKLGIASSKINLVSYLSQL